MPDGTTPLAVSERQYMSYEDPFDSIPDDNVKEVPTVEETVVEIGDSGEISVTTKGTGRQSDRWVVLRGTPNEVDAILDLPVYKRILDKSWRAAEYDARRDGVAPQQSVPPSGAAPQQANQAPGGEKRFCSHGEMVFKSGVAKASGKPYQLFSCPAPREQQCPAQFLK